MKYYDANKTNSNEFMNFVLPEHAFESSRLALNNTHSIHREGANVGRRVGSLPAVMSNCNAHTGSSTVDHHSQLRGVCVHIHGSYYYLRTKRTRIINYYYVSFVISFVRSND